VLDCQRRVATSVTENRIFLPHVFEMLTMEPSDSKATSPTLLAGIGRGNSNAWERLVACYKPTIMAWCRSKGLDEASSLDVVQETFLSVSKSLSKFQSTPGSGAFRAWLWRITQYRILDQRRQRHRQPHGIGGSSIAEKLALVADSHLYGQSSSIALRSAFAESPFAESPFSAALEKFSQSYESRIWQAFLRTAVDGRSTEEVAAEFNMSAVGVRQLRSRILRRLRTELEPFGDWSNADRNANRITK